ncbi:site-specific integrase [Vibrio parahaemolyticus]|uniref:tyrosine-type recombinase/integrase n=1 Tax=Gammaproteobacteria TaxID=1236 RepID=UPI0013CA1396|nr:MULTISPECIES: site-specific integrase [Gammaproteobacteria]MCG6489642.1 site-specific integrase [Vibrio parahaemolyticus]NGE93542.1 tyrosine-type recombinase/integrase [Morganella morganii]
MDDVTFKYLTDQYFYSKSLRPRSEKSYLKVVRTFGNFSAVSPADVDHHVVLGWRHLVLQEQKRAPRTWNNKVAHMRALFNFGIAKGFLPHDENPFYYTQVRVGKKRKKILTKNQMEALYRRIELYLDLERVHGNSLLHSRRPNAMLPAWFWSTVMNVLRYTAMRLGQLLYIRWCDVNLEERLINLCSEGSKNHNDSQIPIVDALYPSLEYLMVQAEKAGMEPKHQLFNVGWFHPGHKRKYPELMDEAPLRSFFRRLSRECKFTVTPHRFRHTVATHMMKSPERNLYVVKRLLGHVSLASTMEYIDENVDGLRNILETELM